METKRYKRPPLAERAISLGVSMDEEHFQRCLNSWNDVMRQSFPQSEIINQWEITISEKNGMPFIPKENQKITTKYRFWKGKTDNRDSAVQVWRDRVAFNLLSRPGEPRTFEDLKSLFSEWCPKWANHFGVVKFSGITLEYVNIFSQTTMPKFYHGNRIDVGNILTAFTVPGPLKNLLPPFHFEFNFDPPSSSIPMKVHIKLTSLRGKNISLRLIFKASSEEPKREIGLDNLWREVEFAHDLILVEFDAFFTDKAKLSFEPA